MQQSACFYQVCILSHRHEKLYFDEITGEISQTALEQTGKKMQNVRGKKQQTNKQKKQEFPFLKQEHSHVSLISVCRLCLLKESGKERESYHSPKSSSCDQQE